MKLRIVEHNGRYWVHQLTTSVRYHDNQQDLFEDNSRPNIAVMGVIAMVGSRRGLSGRADRIQIRENSRFKQ